MEWREDDWLYLCSDTDNLPSWEIEINNNSESESNNEEDVLVSQYDDFNNTVLNINFQSLRVPAETFMSLTERPGFLRLYGKESMFSKFTQSMIARRQQNFVYSAETCVEFEPEITLQLAGLICYYNTENYYYLRISMDEELGGKCIGVLASINNDLSESMTQDDNILITDVERIYLKVEVNFGQLRFFFATNKDEWRPIGKVYDASTLSDDAIKGSWAFTGAFVGIACQDLSGMNKYADFDYFSYVEGR